MPHAISRRWRGPLRTAALTVGTALACAAPAGAATTTYPVGAGTFDADAQGWVASDASCAMTGGVSVLCTASGAHAASGGNPGGALTTRVDVTVNVLGLFSGANTWTSPTFDVPADADVTGAALTFDAAFAIGGLLNLGVGSEIDVTLADLTAADTTPLASVALDDGDTAFAPQGGALPAGAIEAGHRYRLVFVTSFVSARTSAGLLGRSTTTLDNVALEVTTADPPGGGGGDPRGDPDPRGGDDGRGGGGGGSGGGAGGSGSGGDGGAGGSGGTGTTSSTGSGGTHHNDAATAMTASAFASLLRTLDLRAQAGSLAGGSLVPAASCTIVGTPRADRLVGTRGIDVICGLGGNDVIVGGGGGDLIDGGAGRDRLRGGRGDDVLLGLAGADRLVGGAGRDVLAGGAARDRLLGGPGADRLLGGAGRDVAAGNLRRDRIAGVERLPR